MLLALAKSIYYTPVVLSKIVSYSRPKWAKSIPAFRLKRRKDPTLWGGTYLYGVYIREYLSRGEQAYKSLHEPYPWPCLRKINWYHFLWPKTEEWYSITIHDANDQRRDYSAHGKTNYVLWNRFYCPVTCCSVWQRLKSWVLARNVKEACQKKNYCIQRANTSNTHGTTQFWTFAWMDAF